MFAWLIAPCSRAEFERDYYERRLWHMTRPEPDYYRGLVSWSDLDGVLGCHGVSAQEVGLVRGEEPVAKSTYAQRSGRIDPRRLCKHFDDGATIIFNQLHKRIPALGELCALMSEVFGSRVQTNVYLTPPGAQGFAPHWDTHDVFVLQVAGRKQWTIYDTKASLPLRGQAFDSKREPAGKVTEEFELRQGSAVYIPRGVVHSARSVDDTSLHVTLGLTTFTWTDFLLESVAATALQEESLRRSLPLGSADRDLSTERREQLIREKLEVLLSRVPTAEVWRYFQERLSTLSAPLLDDGLRMRLAAEVTPASTVVRRLGVTVGLEDRGADCVLSLWGQEVEFPGWMKPAVSFVVERTRFRVSALPDCLEEDHKVAFVARLMREGLLQIEAAEEGARKWRERHRVVPWRGE